jgi:hypothetical protein
MVLKLVSRKGAALQARTALGLSRLSVGVSGGRSVAAGRQWRAVAKAIVREGRALQRGGV